GHAVRRVRATRPAQEPVGQVHAAGACPFAGWPAGGLRWWRRGWWRWRQSGHAKRNLQHRSDCDLRVAVAYGADYAHRAVAGSGLWALAFDFILAWVEYLGEGFSCLHILALCRRFALIL